MQQPALWHEALTHGSLGEARDYQRLEFLGDRVLGLAVAEWLHEASDAAEGKLSQRLNALVSRETCADVARALGVPAHIRLGKQARDDGDDDEDRNQSRLVGHEPPQCVLRQRAALRRFGEKLFGIAAEHGVLTGDASHQRSLTFGSSHA